MSEALKCLYLSFDHAPVDVREKVSLSEGEVREFVRLLAEQDIVREFIVLSTCNRTEVYYVSDKDMKDQFVDQLCRYKSVAETRSWYAMFGSETEVTKAVSRLFHVSNGLLSQVLGDVQIIRQVKDAYDIAAQAGAVGSYLHRVFQLVFASHKDVSTYTALHNGNASVSSAASDVIRQRLRKDYSKSILVIGAGRFSREVVEQLRKKKYFNISILNRDEDKAQQLAKRFHLQCVPYESINHLLDYDVIISCVAAGKILITEEQLSVRRGKETLLIDLSVPRTIDPGLEGAEGFKLINMDRIEEQNGQAIEKRQRAIPKVDTIIEAYCNEFYEWETSNLARPVINDFKSAIEEIRIKEINRHLKKYKDASIDAELIEEVTRSMVNKIVKIPAMRLNEAGNKNVSEMDKLKSALASLFDLKEVQGAIV